MEMTLRWYGSKFDTVTLEQIRQIPGVPGLYDPREAHMANLFGFPQFTSSYISILELTEDECENSESFGHWCRYLM